MAGFDKNSKLSNFLVYMECNDCVIIYRFDISTEIVFVPHKIKTLFSKKIHQSIFHIISERLFLYSCNDTVIKLQR